MVLSLLWAIGRVSFVFPITYWSEGIPRQTERSLSHSLAGLREQFFHEFAMHVRMPEVAGLETIRQFRVFETE